MKEEANQNKKNLSGSVWTGFFIAIQLQDALKELQILNVANIIYKHSCKCIFKTLMHS